MAAGAGYNIPISLSAADSFSVPTSFASPTYFNFSGSNVRQGGDVESNPLSYAPATAVSSAAQDSPGARGGSANVPGLPEGIFKDKSKMTWVAVAAGAVALIAIGVAIYVARRK